MALALANPGDESLEPVGIDPGAVGARALVILKRSDLYKRARKERVGEIEASFVELRRWLAQNSPGSSEISVEEAMELLADHFSRLVRFRLARAGYGNRQARVATGERVLESFDKLVAKGFEEGPLLRLNKRIATIFEGV